MSLLLEKLCFWFVGTANQPAHLQLITALCTHFFKSCFDWFPDVLEKMVITVFQHEVTKTDVSRYLNL